MSYFAKSLQASIARQAWRASIILWNFQVLSNVIDKIPSGVIHQACVGWAFTSTSMEKKMLSNQFSCKHLYKACESNENKLHHLKKWENNASYWILEYILNRGSSTMDTTMQKIHWFFVFFKYLLMSTIQNAL